MNSAMEKNRWKERKKRMKDECSNEVKEKIEDKGIKEMGKIGKRGWKKKEYRKENERMLK